MMNDNDNDTALFFGDWCKKKVWWKQWDCSRFYTVSR